ncbi:hypothetical protein J4E85_003626 [Alternaria conjuncta]|uniref:uncharacterized protein n=1 Tax=Alternaria conjuncta TaxID=181017 RepID=UPI00221E6972|nr:uncharacterized protein J4E85_003626 [Alternaria conjuncta]KAI4933221.1 hypothetical protein J4E85_003626 [Alternaria conjuncta]
MAFHESSALARMFIVKNINIPPSPTVPPDQDAATESERLNLSFMDLPRELRDIVYELYLPDTESTYDAKTHKFTITNKEADDMSLGFTCHTILEELLCRAFEVNLTFHAAFVHTPRESDDQWVDDIGHILLYKEDVVDEMARHDWGEAPSIYRDFIQHTLTVLAKHPEFAHDDIEWMDILRTPSGAQLPARNLLDLTNLQSKLWSIPTDGDFMHNVSISGFPTENNDYPNTVRYPFSAAAIAIRFLNCLPLGLRKQIQCLRLVENRTSIAHPECHMRGFIPFCIDMPKLRIERRVSIWKTASTCHHPYPWLNERRVYVREGRQEGKKKPKRNRRIWPNWSPPSFHDWFTAHVLPEAQSVTKAIAPWIIEADALESLGMPAGACTLLFKGDAAVYPKLAHNMFNNVVQHDAAWQMAMDLTFKPKDSEASQIEWFAKRRRRGYFYETFPVLLQHMTAGIGRIKCDFDLGVEQDARTVAQSMPHQSSVHWDWLWRDHQLNSNDTAYVLMFKVLNPNRPGPR